MKPKPIYKTEYDVLTVRRYGDIDKIYWLSKVRREKTNFWGVDYDDTEKQTPTNDEKLRNNLIRAKSTVTELALCNVWEYFCTFTVSPQRFDRYNLKEIYRAFSKWLNNYNRTANVKYLIIPEQHKDGAWHFHGLLSGIPSHDIIQNLNGYSSWLPYSERFGFCSLSPVKDHVKVAHYLTKYITKSLGASLGVGEHTYYASHGLKRSEIILQGSYRLRPGVEWDYTNDEKTYSCKTYNNNNNDYSEFIY